MKKIQLKYLALLLLNIILIQSVLFAQESKLEAYSNKLLFNIFTENPDPTLCKYIRKNISINYCQPRPKADTIPGWSIKDSSLKRLSRPKFSTHFFYFKKHPSFKGKFVSGKIKIGATEQYKNIAFINEASVLLFFKNKKDAEETYWQLVYLLSNISTDKKMSNYNDIQKAEFNDSSANNKNVKAELILNKRSFHSHNYCIIFKNHNNI